MPGGRWPRGIATVLALAWVGAPARASQGVPCLRFRIEDGTRIVVPVRINEQGPYQFLLDTGAAITMVDDAVARRISLKPMATIGLTTFTGIARIPLAPVESLSLGGRVVRRMKVVFCDLSKVYSFNRGIHGVLGQDFLSNFNYLIDRKERNLRLEESDELGSTLRGRKIPAERRQSKFYLLIPGADGDAAPLRFLVDSGSPHLVVYSKPALADRLSVVYCEPGALVTESGIGRRKLKPCRISGLRLGEIAGKALRVIMAELLPGEVRFEDGVLPLSMFDGVYFNNTESYVILNPVLPRHRDSARP